MWPSEKRAEGMAARHSHETHKLQFLYYLVPIKAALFGCLPSKKLLQRFPQLDARFGGVFEAIATGDLLLYEKEEARHRSFFKGLAITPLIATLRIFVLRTFIRRVTEISAELEKGEDIRSKNEAVTVKLDYLKMGLKRFYNANMTDAEFELLMVSAISKDVIRAYIGVQGGHEVFKGPPYARMFPPLEGENGVCRKLFPAPGPR